MYYGARYGTNTPWRANSVLGLVDVRPSAPPSKTCTAPSCHTERSPSLIVLGTSASKRGRHAAVAADGGVGGRRAGCGNCQWEVGDGGRVRPAARGLLVVAVRDPHAGVDLQLAGVVGEVTALAHVGEAQRDVHVSLVRRRRRIAHEHREAHVPDRVHRLAVGVGRPDREVVRALLGRVARTEGERRAVLAVGRSAGLERRHQRHAQRRRALGTDMAARPVALDLERLLEGGPVDPVDRADGDGADRAEAHGVEAPLVALAGGARCPPAARRPCRGPRHRAWWRARRSRRRAPGAARRGTRSASRCRSRCARTRRTRTGPARGAGPSRRIPTSRPGRRCRGGRRGCWARCRRPARPCTASKRSAPISGSNSASSSRGHHASMIWTRVGVVVLAVLVAVDAMRARGDPVLQRADGVRQLRVARGADHLQQQRQHLVAAQVLGPGVLHRVDHLGQAHLAGAREQLVDLVVQRLRAVVRAVAPLPVGGVEARRLLVVPGGDVVLVDHLRVLLEGRHVGALEVRLPALPVVLAGAPVGEVGVGARRRAPGCRPS